MRSPSLLLVLVTAAITTPAFAQELFQHAQRQTPAVHGGVGSFHVESPRQYASERVPRPEEESRRIDRERQQAERDRMEALRDHRPEPQHLADDPNVVPAKGKGENGGVSVSPPALGADADDGGSNDRTGDGSSASGFGVDYIVEKVANSEYFSNFIEIGLSTLAGKVSAYQPDIPQNNSSYEFQPQGHASGDRVKRSPKITTYVSSRKRQDISDIVGVGDDEEEDDGSTDENSGQDGADGQSIRGTETDGPGPYGGHAHAGYPGSSEGGHVYNYPDGSDEQ
ncbi:hypothetical protein C8Q76DRAFT_791920 [Earliella scabrosa]|nr:hypothetical protein C8Q76DRAFT_791920 [Earliella scabrosa]